MPGKTSNGGQPLTSIDLSGLYTVPWTAMNNANGWIEPTTHCQLKCPGCYRGLAGEDHVPENMELEALKKQVDFLVEKRHVQTVSIAGGNPCCIRIWMHWFHISRPKGPSLLSLPMDCSWMRIASEPLNKKGLAGFCFTWTGFRIERTVRMKRL